MRKPLTITDVTRMQEGRVCIAGYDQEGKCIRPVLPPPGIKEISLYLNGQPIVFHFAIVEFDLLYPTPQPPHTEDYRYDPQSTSLIGRLDEKGKSALLEGQCFDSVGEIFGAQICTGPGYYVIVGEGSRSLGTIKPDRIIRAIFECGSEGNWKYRLKFLDGAKKLYRLTITDLTWRYYCDFQFRQGCTPDEISASLTSLLNMAYVYLRIGLARGWEKYPDRCYLQITGIYSFPDYLQGSTFTDFISARASSVSGYGRHR